MQRVFSAWEQKRKSKIGKKNSKGMAGHMWHIVVHRHQSNQPMNSKLNNRVNDF